MAAWNISATTAGIVCLLLGYHRLAAAAAVPDECVDVQMITFQEAAVQTASFNESDRAGQTRASTPGCTLGAQPAGYECSNKTSSRLWSYTKRGRQDAIIQNSTAAGPPAGAVASLNELHLWQNIAGFDAKCEQLCQDDTQCGGFAVGTVTHYDSVQGGELLCVLYSDCASSTYVDDKYRSTALRCPALVTKSMAAAVGDPHMTNTLGQHFDLAASGNHVLVHIPRFAEPSRLLLKMIADVQKIGGACSDIYIQGLNITGKWSSGKQSHFGVEQKHGGKAWVTYGKVDVKVVQGHTKKGVHYLNVFTRGLDSTGFKVGGLLGIDDHSVAARPNPACKRVMSL